MCKLCGKILPDRSVTAYMDHLERQHCIEFEERCETVFYTIMQCPRCGSDLNPVYFMGEELDFLDCQKCGVAYHPTTLKPLAQIV
jgi:ribosomal protein S27AE